MASLSERSSNGVPINQLVSRFGLGGENCRGASCGGVSVFLDSVSTVVWVLVWVPGRRGCVGVGLVVLSKR